MYHWAPPPTLLAPEYGPYSVLPLGDGSLGSENSLLDPEYPTRTGVNFQSLADEAPSRGRFGIPTEHELGQAEREGASRTTHLFGAQYGPSAPPNYGAGPSGHVGWLQGPDPPILPESSSSSLPYPYDIRLEASSDRDPVGVRITGSKPRDFLLQCGVCTDWIRHNATSVDAASRSALSKHLQKSECKTVWRLIQSGTLTQTLDRGSRGSRESFVSSSSIPQHPLSSLSSRPACPGVPLVWPSDDFALDYVWHMQSKMYQHMAKWRICAYDEEHDMWQIRAMDCDPRHPNRSRPCAQCARVEADVQEKHDSVMDPVKARTANYHNRSWRVLAERLRHEQEVNHGLNFQLINMTRAHDFAAGRVEKFEEIMKILSTHDVSRLSNILSTSQRQHLSLGRIAERLVLEIAGTYRSTGHYTSQENDFALLSLRLGGYRMLHALAKEYGLPSRSTVQAAHVSLTVEPCIVEPDDATIIRNICRIIIELRRGRPRPEYSFIFSLDETALDAMMAYYPLLRAMAGICTQCFSLTLNDIEVKSVPQMLDLADEVRGTESTPPKYHLANQATVVCVVFQGADDHRALPILISPCCGRKDASQFVKLINQIHRCWAASGAEALFGKPLGWSTDGDSSRRKGGFSAFKVKEINPNDPTLGIIRQLKGMDYKTGPNGETLDFDQKHGFKRAGTVIRAQADGMYIGGRAVTTGLLTKYLRKTGMSEAKIDVLLQPDDAQNVACAVELIRALRIVSDLSPAILDFGEHQDVRAISAFAEIFGAFVDGFTNDSLSLSDQMASLSKYAHMAAYLRRTDGAKFMKGELYADTMACVTNAFISLAKQQKLGPHLPFFLFLLGSDGVEKLFACVRMLGGHSPNFNVVELGIRLGHAMDLVRIFEQHPEWHAGLRRLDVSREHVKVDRLTPHQWRTSPIAGNAVIPDAWDHGRDGGTDGLERALGIRVDWDDFWSIPGSNIQSLAGNGQYIGVDLLDTDEGDVPSDNVLADPLPLDDTTTPPTYSDRDESSNKSPGGFVGAAPEIRGEFDEGAEDALVLATTPDELGRARAHSTPYEGRSIHNATLVRLLFNDNTHHRQSKDRLSRVRTYATPTVTSQLQSMAQDSCVIGDRVATVVQVGKKAFMALVQITHLYQAGHLLHGVRRSELCLPQSKIEVRGQVLELQPSALPSCSGAVPVYVWKGSFVRLRPTSGGQNAHDVLALRFAGCTATDLSALDLHPSSTDDLTVAATRALGGLVFDCSKLDALLEIISHGWLTSEGETQKTSACHPNTTLFPYRKHGDGTEPAFELALFSAPDVKAARSCRQCCIGVPGAKRLSHVGRHILRNKRGVMDVVPPGGQQMPTDNPCGFCGRSPPCPVTLATSTRSKHVASECPDFHDGKYGSANSSSNANPSTNVPVICMLCPPDRTRAQQPAIWKYNMGHHLRTHHDGYAVPGWPALAGVHDATADVPGHRLPLYMTEALQLDEEEENRLGLSRSTPWGEVGTAEGTALHSKVSLSVTRHEATARLQGLGGKRRADELDMVPGLSNKRAK